MSDLLIVGNAFDLYYDLPTRYTDFCSFTPLYHFIDDIPDGKSIVLRL